MNCIDQLWFSIQKHAGFDGLESCRPFLPEPQYSVIGPVLEEEAEKIHATFWSQEKS